jgi:hypothetical protein
VRLETEVGHTIFEFGKGVILSNYYGCARLASAHSGPRRAQGSGDVLGGVEVGGERVKQVTSTPTFTKHVKAQPPADSGHPPPRAAGAAMITSSQLASCTLHADCLMVPIQHLCPQA